jgi:type IV pilus assembly protein PilV
MRNPQGLTLIEVVIAMGLVFLALLALSGLATVSWKGAATGRHLTTATMLAQEKIEEVKLNGDNSNIVNKIEIDEPYESLPDFPLYRRVSTINPSDPTVGLQAVTVTVSWAADAHMVSLSTILVE